MHDASTLISEAIAMRDDIKVAIEAGFSHIQIKGDN